MIRQPVRWGSLGVSTAVGRLGVLPAIVASPYAELLAIASRDESKARAEAERFGAARAHGSYEALLADDAVEAVYLPLPNGLHHQWAGRALAAGKHVLCEKPLTLGAAEARALFEQAAAAGLVLVEAHWTNWQPRYLAMLESARRGEAGAVHHIDSVFTFRLADRGDHRMDPALGGGSLADLGTYCAAPLIDLELGAVESIEVVRRGGRVVDLGTQAFLRFDSGASALLRTAFDEPEGQRLVITGDAGRIAASSQVFTAQGETAFEQVVLTTAGEPETRTLRFPAIDPYRVMTDHVSRQVRGAVGPQREPAAVVATLELLEQIRAAG